jgi:hypothetical protein
MLRTTEYQISCVVKDPQGVITHVGINGTPYDVMTVVGWSTEHLFYTYRHGYRAQVYAKQDTVSRRWFLTTEPDSTKEDNLDFLPHC